MSGALNSLHVALSTILFDKRTSFTGLLGYRSEAKVKVRVININTPCFMEAYVYVGVSNIQVNDQFYSYPGNAPSWLRDKQKLLNAKTLSQKESMLLKKKFCNLRH